VKGVLEGACICKRQFSRIYEGAKVVLKVIMLLDDVAILVL